MINPGPRLVRLTIALAALIAAACQFDPYVRSYSRTRPAAEELVGTWVATRDTLKALAGSDGGARPRIELFAPMAAFVSLVWLRPLLSKSWRRPPKLRTLRPDGSSPGTRADGGESAWTGQPGSARGKNEAAGTPAAGAANLMVGPVNIGPQPARIVLQAIIEATDGAPTLAVCGTLLDKPLHIATTSPKPFAVHVAMAVTQLGGSMTVDGANWMAFCSGADGPGLLFRKGQAPTPVVVPKEPPGPK